MLRKTPLITPTITEGISERLVVCLDSGEIICAKVCQWDDEDFPAWYTASADSFTVDPSNILWWAYASDVKALVEDQ